MAAENNLIKKADLARAREVDFVYRFTDSIKKLVEALGVTRTIPKAAGTYLKAYKATELFRTDLLLRVILFLLATTRLYLLTSVRFLSRNGERLHPLRLLSRRVTIRL